MNQRKKAALLITACIFAMSLISLLIKEALYSDVQASSIMLDNKDSKVVIILTDYIELRDFAENEYLAWLFNSGYSAMVSGRQNGKTSAVKAKLTIGAGRRLEISSGLKSAFNTAMASDEDYGKVSYIDIHPLRHQNKESDYNNFIGYLGSTLNQNNKVSCVLGNSDTEIIDRSAALIAMDENGEVDNGDVEKILLQDVGFPGGKRTDYGKLLTSYKQLNKACDLIIIDTGDLARIEYYKGKLETKEYKAFRNVALDNIADFTKDLIAASEQDTVFIMLSTYPSKSCIQSGFKLTPIILYNNIGAGFIYSESTKRTGIITTLDIADFILEELRLKDKSGIMLIKQEKTLHGMLILARKLLNISSMRLPVMTWYAIFEIICATIGLLYLLNASNKESLLNKFIKIILLANIAAPAVLLYMALFRINNAAIYFLIFISLSLIIALGLFIFIKNITCQFLGAALLVNLSLVFDLIRGSALIKNSLFGYDPIIGARFYGIGNEYAGVFIGSGILLAGCFLEYYKEKVKRNINSAMVLLVIFFCLQLYMIGMPNMGANFGGTVAAIAGYFFFCCAVMQYRIKIKHILVLTLIMIVVLSGIIVLDVSSTSSSTHIGKFITDIKENGVKVLYSTIARKAAMNLKLIKYTIWTKVLLCIILIISVMFFKPVRLLYSIFKKYQYFTAAWLGISAGSIAGLIVNDSGIVMAATAMIFTGYTIMYICLEERQAIK